MTYIQINAGSNSQNIGNNEMVRQFREYYDVALGLTKEIENNSDILAAKLKAQQPDDMIDNIVAKRLTDTSNMVNKMCEKIKRHTRTTTGFPEILDELSISYSQLVNILFALRELAVAMKTGYDKLVSLKRLL